MTPHLHSTDGSGVEDLHLCAPWENDKVEYRRALVASFLFKFFVHVANMLEADSQVGAGDGSATACCGEGNVDQNMKVLLLLMLY
eukprot:1147322-Pelagomonas_calceolata.AAC.4